MEANGLLKTPISTLEFQCEVSFIDFTESFNALLDLASLPLGLIFLQRNEAVLDTNQDILVFTYLFNQLENIDKEYSNVMEHIKNPTDFTVPPQCL